MSLNWPERTSPAKPAADVCRNARRPISFCRGRTRSSFLDPCANQTEKFPVTHRRCFTSETWGPGPQHPGIAFHVVGEAVARHAAIQFLIHNRAAQLLVIRATPRNSRLPPRLPPFFCARWSVEYFRVRILMARFATHHSGSSTIGPALYTHCVDFPRRAKLR